MNISMRSVLTAGVATITASAVVFAPSVQPPPRPEPVVQLAANVQVTGQTSDYLSQLGEWWQPLFLPSANQPFPPPPTGPVPTPGSVWTSLEGAYHAIEPWVRYGFEVAQYVAGWIPYVGWFSGQIMILYHFGESIVHAIAHNVLDWLNGDGNFLQNLGEGIRWSIDALIQLGIDEWNYFLPPLPPFPPIPCILFCNNLSELNAPLDAFRLGLRDTVTDLLTQLAAILGPQDPDEPEVGLPTLMSLTPQSPLGGITDALVNASETYFKLTSGVTEFGLFKLAEPVLRNLKLGLVADQVDINYFDLFKPTTIQQLDGLNEALTVPDRFLTDLGEGQGLLEALGTEAGFVADRLVTRVGKTGTVVEKYVEKQVDYFTKDLPTPPSGKLVKTITQGKADTSVSLFNDGKDPLKKAIGSFKANAGALGENSGKPKPVKSAVKGLAAKVKSLRDGVKDSLGASHKKTDNEAPK